MPEVPQEGTRQEDRARVPTQTTIVGHHGIHLTLARSSSKDMASTTATANPLNCSSEPYCFQQFRQQSSRIINPSTLNSSASTSSLQNAQKIVLGGSQTRPNVTFVRLNQPGVQQLPPVQRIVLRDQLLARPETPDRVIHQRFSVKSVDRDPGTPVSGDRIRESPPTGEPYRINLTELMSEQLKIATIRFEERVAE